MRAGQLNQLVTFKQLVGGVDAIGQPVNTWVTVADLWAHILYKKGIEEIRANADVSITQASLRIRYTTQLNAGMRGECDGVVYEIKALLPNGKEHMDLVCEVVT